MTTRPDLTEARFAVCLRNEANPASLEIRKLYRVLPDPDASAAGLLRIVDETGEDYLYPAEDLLVLTPSREAEQALLKAS